MTAATLAFRPPAPTPRDKPLGLFGTIATLRRNPIEIWTRMHYEEPVLVGRTPFGERAVVSDPAGVRRIFLDNVANYRKDDTPESPLLKQEALNSLGHLVVTKMNIPTIGASGAVFGILLAYGLTFPNSLIYIYFLLPIKAKWFVLIYAVLEFWFGISGAGDNVAHFAHLGGMLFGYLLIVYWKKKGELY